MHLPARFAAVTLSIAVLSSVPAATMAAAPADRAGNSWTTIGKYEGAEHQACKALINDGAAWRIKNRLVNGNQSKVGAGMTVQKNGEDTSRRWDSGLIAKRETSAVGSVNLPKGDDRYSLVAFEYAPQSGTGGPVALSTIGRC